MISKELLSEVTNIPISALKSIRYGNSLMEITKTNDRWEEINIYELAHKCKEWDFNKGGIDITSGKRLGLDGWECLVFVGVIPCDCYEADTEHEAIFKACEWILKDKR